MIRDILKLVVFNYSQENDYFMINEQSHHEKVVKLVEEKTYYYYGSWPN